MAHNIKNILVTGAVGFIGTHLCSRLISEGYFVVGIDSLLTNTNATDYDYKLKRSNIDLLYSIKGSFKLELCDILNENRLRSIFYKYYFDAVIHLGALAGVRGSIESPFDYINTNIVGTTNILELVKECGITNFVFASSSSVYGESSEVPFHEDMKLDSPISQYACTKKSGELLCSTYNHQYNISMAVLRFFTVYGPRQRPDLAIHKFARLMLNGDEIKCFGDGSTLRDYTYIDDIVDGVVRSLKFIEKSKGIYSIFNLGSGNPIKLIDLIKQLEKALNIKANIKTYPTQMGDVTRTYASIYQANLLLGYTPKTTIEEGLTQFTKWFFDFNKNLDN